MVAEPQLTEQELPPGPAGLPLVGSLPQFQRDPLAFVRGVQRTYGSIATVRFGRDAVVIMCFRPEHAQYFLVTHARDFITGSGRIVMKRFLGDGLLTTDGDFHRQQRRLVLPAFHKKRVESYASLMVEQTSQRLDGWHAGAELDVARELQELTLRIVVKALFDVDLLAEGQALSQAFTEVVEGQSPFGQRFFAWDLPFTPYHRALAAADRLDDFVYRLIAQRRAEGGDTGDVLSMLLQSQDEEDGTGLTDKQVRDQTMTLIAAGHETTSNALAWTFHLLSRNPDKRAKLISEIRDVLGSRTITVDDLPNLPYLDWVVNESMRIYPPAWTLGRTAIAPFELEGYQFPAGTRVMFSQWVIHHLPDVWGDPENFRPERWDSASGFRPPRGAYFPFGAGPRICIGMPFAELEARLLLATILQRYVPEVVPGWRVEPLPRVTLRLKHGLRVRVSPSPAA
jgi:cytochrome P450